MNKRQVLAWTAAALITRWLLSMTLRPGNGRPYVHLVPFSYTLPEVRCVLVGCPWWRAARISLVVDVGGNIAVFVPFGAAVALALSPAPLRKRGWLQLAAIGGALSLGIELAQLAVPGRVTDIDDLILNVLGTLLGGAAMAAVLYFIKEYKT